MNVSMFSWKRVRLLLTAVITFTCRTAGIEMSVLNFNVGVLGHVDSGKTSLAKALSSVASTACFDKNPQSKERGITLDLGFSSFTVDFPEHLKEDGVGLYDKLQFTLVDCPGHASLIKTIIGGFQFFGFCHKSSFNLIQWYFVHTFRCSDNRHDDVGYWYHKRNADTNCWMPCYRRNYMQPDGGGSE